eukprot:364591-Chlamydomonas_euryale.AAC.2
MVWGVGFGQSRRAGVGRRATGPAPDRWLAALRVLRQAQGLRAGKGRQATGPAPGRGRAEGIQAADGSPFH